MRMVSFSETKSLSFTKRYNIPNPSSSCFYSRRHGLRNLSHSKRPVLHPALRCVLVRTNASHACTVDSTGCISRCGGAWCGEDL